MTRREFLEQMLISTFGVKGIEYLNTTGGVALYNVGGTVYSKCAYSQKYKTKFITFWKALFNSNSNEIVIKNKVTRKENIEIYQSLAKEYVYQIIPLENNDNILSKENLTLRMTEYIYVNIILKELFDVEEPDEDRGNDDFSESAKKINEEIIKYISAPYEYKEDFFNEIIEKYPIFRKLHLNEKNKLVFDDIDSVEKYICNSKKLPLSIFNLELQNLISIRAETLERNGKLAMYIDRPGMEAVDFELLTSVITGLYSYSECYPQVFSEKEIKTLANTAIRAYNHFYGKNHVVYSGKANNNHWEMHQHLIEYLFMLQLVME